MKLKDLLKNVNYKTLSINEDLDITNLSMNSKTVGKNGLFFALKGNSFNGNDFIPEAALNGAEVVVSDDEESANVFAGTVLVKNVRKAINQIAKNFYGNNYNFKTIAITGTNGKTSISFMLAHALRAAGYDVGVIGTSGVFFNDERLRPEGLTTPDSLEFFELMGMFNKLSVEYVIFELSAHALYYDKTLGLKSDYAIFTNLTEDHLDFFKTMENYGKAKQKMFTSNYAKMAIINTDDPFGLHLYQKTSLPVVTYGENMGTCIRLLKTSKDLKYAKIKVYDKVTKLRMREFNGKYNFYNAMAAIAVLVKEGIKIKTIKKAFATLPKIEGRQNAFKIKNHGTVILDFAHTPDGLEKILTYAKTQTAKKGKLISVFGCGGNRDENKRPIMGEISAKIADFTYISIDNPRYEDASKVMNDVAVGARKIGNNYKITMPRTEAIREAIENSKVGDVIVVSGKGVEPYYDDHGTKYFYREDREIVKIKKELEKC